MQIRGRRFDSTDERVERRAVTFKIGATEEEMKAQVEGATLILNSGLEMAGCPARVFIHREDCGGRIGIGVEWLGT